MPHRTETPTTNIRHHLTTHNITAGDVADFLEITPSEAADHIEGHTPWPLDRLYRLATHTGIPPEAIFADAR